MAAPLDRARPLGAALLALGFALAAALTGCPDDPSDASEDAASGEVVADPGGGTADPGPADPGARDPGPPDQGPSDQGTSDPGVADPGPPDPGSADPGAPDPGAADVPPDVPAADVPPPETFPLACADPGDCVVACGVGICDGGQCRFDPPQGGCVIVDEAAGTGTCVPPGALHPSSSCLFCNPGLQAVGYTPRFFGEDFEHGLGAVQVANLAGTLATWSVTDARAASGGQSLYFGDKAAGTYDVGKRAWARATLPTQDIPEGVAPTLRFSLWLDTESTDGYDFLQVLVFGADPEPVIAWHSDQIDGTTGGAFLPVLVDLSAFAGQQVIIAFEFDTVDELINGFEGAYVDTIQISSGCCVGGADCDDADPCTLDTCPAEGGTCEHVADPLCCNVDADCDDGNDCTVDACPAAGGGCANTPIAGCCHVKADCDDSDPCTEDTCDVAAQACHHLPLCCEADGDCDDGDACTDGRCLEGQCVYDFTCCLSDGECDDGEYCTFDRCVDGACVNEAASLPGCCSPDVLSWTFDDGELEGWTFSPADGGVAWQVANLAEAQSPPGALYYGNPVAKNFNSGAANDGEALSAPVDLPEGVALTLTFQAYIDGESGTSYDAFWLDVVTDVDTFEIVNKTKLVNQAWTKVTVDLTYLGGKTIRFRFRFATGDGVLNDGLGCLIDDFAITSTCEPRTCIASSGCQALDKCTAGVCEAGQCSYVDSCCQGDDECDDGLVCTDDSCSGGKCQFKKVAGCCESELDCDDGNPCTTDLCSGYGGQCANEPIDGCCLINSDCDDGDGCTIDTCGDNWCGHQNICCSSDAECDDGDDVCTDDACVDSFCKHTPTGVVGCCDPAPLSWDFEQPVTLTYEQSDPSCAWQVVGFKAKSGTKSLWYGNKATGDYDCGDAHEGAATSEPITLQPAVDYALSFQLFMDTEQGSSYDVLTVEAVMGATTLTLWTKPQMNPKAFNVWGKQQIDLSALAGQTFQLRFHFDTVDGVLNGDQGTFVDDVTIVSTCNAVSCSSSGDCNDGLSDSKDACVGGECQYTLP